MDYFLEDDVFTEDEEYELSLSVEKRREKIRNVLLNNKSKGFDFLFLKNIKFLKIFVGFVYGLDLIDELLDFIAENIKYNDRYENFLNQILNNKTLLDNYIKKEKNIKTPCNEKQKE